VNEIDYQGSIVTKYVKHHDDTKCHTIISSITIHDAEYGTVIKSICVNDAKYCAIINFITIHDAEEY